MVLRLRLARVSTPGGAKRHQPFYNIVLAQGRSARDSKPMEVLGTYDPIPKLPVGAEPSDRKIKDIKVDVSRAKYWLGVGAQPSDTVWRLLSMIGLLEPRYLPSGPQTIKQSRFPTHVPKPDKARKDTKADGTMSQRESEIVARR
ncbi:Ribosomal protein S16, mitochondrial [Fulvia fulva]|uniref:Ribosomal protein S16, mitochondrial n=1 Tax=Passalora fulva TaxID=5499 RepID=A0A9Q8LJD4_PASFU|nr:Ribosomal protein S16, mitochondrial [Fulvia fulva]KAK4623663.1 Ribosomal protein S16, mitochondrial [Fulvia fulva]KAK4625168.1 Ribosomal protein S16, mitochondrial [Fulvia fulva]UJO18234.1 Ribosomal protein S16, mitochondrial [Fulvia fulva]WPV14838.1 Ribosomal protein S16, mitochondrial [Fulvia fulva]WPV30443.1 Ribosomal protein S16, mitochondrial [Fulvia fulva]